MPNQDKKQLNSYTSGPGKLSGPPPKVATTDPIGPGQLSKPAKEYQPIKEKERPYMDTLRPGDKGSLVGPKGRSVNVTATVPEEEQSSSVFTPDKSENYSIRQPAPQDR
jgi:hypothetical protein